MHTFAKEPTTAPVAKNKPKRTPSAAFRVGAALSVASLVVLAGLVLAGQRPP
jgi:hypothetical protein